MNSGVYILCVCVFVQSCVQAVENITSGGKNIDKDGLLLLCNLSDGSRGKLFSQLRTMLLPMKNDPVVALLTLKDNKYGPSVEEMFDQAELNDTPEVHTCACKLQAWAT